MQKRELELLAPAGSYETFEAVIRAGADAVYLGGSHFGARAYANNFNEEELLRAIDYAHIHGRQVYLTVNTLFKEEELEQGLYEYLLPYYEQGLDAVIVQDMGAFARIRSMFPRMDIHTSTQMTVTGAAGAAYMKQLGASRVVMAREMSFVEIREIHDKVGIEIESFVHGALCYCYSGQCLLSSMLGGRSGNRGRCAQPCRLPYEVYKKDQKSRIACGNYVLSPKDLCTIDAIPALAESGIFSFKIEGRMKQAEYAAGVVSVYRQYMDRYLDRLNEERAGGCSEDEARRRAKKAYAVTEEDHRKLLALGNRSGFTDGYYFRRNGREMITFDSPGHAKTDEALQKTVREHYIKVRPEQEIKEKINGFLRLKKDLSATLKLQCEECEITCEGEQVLQAQKQPLSRDRVDVCMRKTGNTPFAFEQLTIEMDEDVFLPVQALNALRREALLALEEKLLQGYRRDGAASPEAEKLGCGADKRTRQEERREAEDAGKTVIVSLENRCLLPVVLRSSFVHGIYADSSCYTRDELWTALLKDAGEAHLAGKKFYYILPAVFRSRTAAFYRENIEHLKALPLDGFVAKSYDAAAFVRQELGAETPLILDHSLYSWNSAAQDVFLQLAPERDTVPLELNRSELFARDNHHSEVMVYGYLPLMTSAQCVHANTEKCDRKRGILYLKDRYGKYFPVKNNCTECYNTIYNTTPLMLFDERADFLRMGIAAYRISFTIEEEEQAAFILDLFERTFLSGKHSVKELFPDGYTRGHYKRGVE